VSDKFQDELTHTNSSADDDDDAPNEAGENKSFVSIGDLDDGSLEENNNNAGSVSESHTSAETDKTSHADSLTENVRSLHTDFSELQRRPRCVLCSKFFQDSDIVTESWDPSCQHHFHKECIVRWLQRKDGCPVCKKEYVVGLVIENGDVVPDV
jgi:Ring finger domain